MNNCTHEHKRCLELEWGYSTADTFKADGSLHDHYYTKVALWHCDDCEQDLLYNYHTKQYEYKNLKVYLSQTL